MSTYLVHFHLLIHVHISCTFPRTFTCPLTCTCSHILYMSTCLVHVHMSCTCPHVLYMSTYLVYFQMSCTCPLILYISKCLVHVHLSCTFPYRTQFIWSCHSVMTSRRFEKCNVFTLTVQHCQRNVLVSYLYSAYEETVLWKAGVRLSSGAATLHLRQQISTLCWRLIRRRERKHGTVCPVLCTGVTVQRLPSSFAVATNKHGEWLSNCR